MRRIQARRRVAMIATVLVMPALAVVGWGGSPAVADALGGGSAVVTVEHTPAPRKVAQAGLAHVFPVPTSSAGLQRITTAPNGDMWFVEQDKNKVGRITTAGAIDEYNLPAIPGEGWVKDLDVDAAGNVWVVYDQGQQIIRFHPSNPSGASHWEFDYPYGEEIRVGPSDATYPDSVAPEPTGKIWFGRSDGGTMFTSPGDGNVGWVGDNGQVGTIRTGDRTAPRSLVTGADGNVWFTSVGAAKGIGHVNAAGAGAVVQIGNYAPTSLTYGVDGAIWFTDETNNAIVRVAREKHKKAKLTVRCGAGIVACAGQVVVKAGKKKVAAGSYAVAVNGKDKMSIKITKKGRRLLQRAKAVKVKVFFAAATGAQSVRKAKLIG